METTTSSYKSSKSELERRVHPRVYLEALDRIQQHKALGQRVYAVSATMEEIIGPLAELLDLDGALASQMEVVDGVFTGAIARANHGAEKAVRLRSLPRRRELTLPRAARTPTQSRTPTSFAPSAAPMR